MFKGFGVPSTLNFTGVIRDSETVLSAAFSNFTLNEAATFESNTFSIHIRPDDQGANSVHLILDGQLLTEPEPEREIRFDTTWSFPVELNSNVTLRGTKTSIYDDVFTLGLFDILEGRISGQIDPLTNVIQMRYTSTSVVGHDCYTHPEYIDWVIDDDNSLHSSIYNYDNSNINADGTLDILSDECRVGNSVLDIFTNGLDHNRYDAQFYFSGYEEFIRVIFNTQPDDEVSLLVDSINLPRGFTTMNVFNDVHDRDYVEFIGTNNFLGIRGYGQVRAYTDREMVNSTVYLPSFTIGGGNLQFLTDNEIQRWYNTENDRYCRGRLDCYDAEGIHTNSQTQFRRNNTLNLEFDTQNMAGTDIHLSANAILFEMLQRVEYSLSEERWDFVFNGKPFRGAFDAEAVVEVIPVADLQNEDNSIVRIVLDQTENYFDLQDLVNDELRKWASNNVISKLQIQDRRAELSELRDYLALTSNEYATCPETEQCQTLPTIRCTEYAQNAVCVEEAQVCGQVTQSCVQRETYTYGWGEYEVCTQFETICDDPEPTTVCLEYQLEDIPDECIAMELSCTRVLLPDQSCADTYERLQTQIGEIDVSLAQLNELSDLLQSITDSSVCMIRLEDEDDRRDNPDCTQRDATLEGIPEEIEMFDFVSLRDTRSVMSLRNVVSSDSIIFESDISLYGDWTFGQPGDNRVLVRHSIEQEEEDEDRGYDLHVESLFFVNHFIDFNSINRTAARISRSIKEIICQENNIQGYDAARIQILLRQFSLIEGNRTICPDLQVVNNDRYIEADADLDLDQPSLYQTIESDDEYISTTLEAEDEATLRFSYRSDPEVIQVSRIREEYDTREQYAPTDDLTNSLIDRVDTETVAETEDIDFTQDERYDQQDIEQEYADEVDQQWIDQAENYQQEQEDVDNVMESEQEQYEENLEEIEENLEEVQESQESADETSQQASENIEEAQNDINNAQDDIEEFNEQEDESTEEVAPAPETEEAAPAPQAEEVTPAPEAAPEAPAPAPEATAEEVPEDDGIEEVAPEVSEEPTVEPAAEISEDDGVVETEPVAESA